MTNEIPGARIPVTGRSFDTMTPEVYEFITLLGRVNLPPEFQLTGAWQAKPETIRAQYTNSVGDMIEFEVTVSCKGENANLMIPSMRRMN